MVADRFADLASLPPAGRPAALADILADADAMSELRGMWAADRSAVEAMLLRLSGVLTSAHIVSLRRALRPPTSARLRLLQAAGEADPNEDDDTPPDIEERSSDGSVPMQYLQTGTTRDGDVVIRPSRWNFGTIVSQDLAWAGKIRQNDLSIDVEILDGDTWRTLNDVDVVHIGRSISDRYGIECPEGTLYAQIAGVAVRNRTHPIREYLEGLTWDGTARIDWAFGSLFGVDSQADEIRACSRAWLISMVARVMQPGCKVDTMPIIIGAQGRGKSSTLRALMPVESWYADSEIPMRGADRYQVLKGRWLFEIGEFDKFSKHEAAEVKAYLSSQVDTYRASYGRAPIQVPRQVVFAGSVNREEFLTDETGSRRFWVVRSGQCEPEWAADHRDQLWAEAVAAYRTGERWWLSAEHATGMAIRAAGATIGDAWDTAIDAYICGRPQVTVPEIHEMLVPDVAYRDNTQEKRIRASLSRLGWAATGARSGTGGNRGPKYWRRRTE